MNTPTAPTSSEPAFYLCNEVTPTVLVDYYRWYDEDTKICMRCDPASNCKLCQKSNPAVCLSCWGDEILDTEGDNTCKTIETIMDNQKYLMSFNGYGSSPVDFTAIETVPFKVKNTVNDVTTYTQKCGVLYIYGGPGIFSNGTQLVAEFKDLNSHYQVRIQFVFYKFGIWLNNSAILAIDGQEIQVPELAGLSFEGAMENRNQCDKKILKNTPIINAGTYEIFVNINVTHQEPNLEINITTDINNTEY